LIAMGEKAEAKKAGMTGIVKEGEKSWRRISKVK